MISKRRNRVSHLAARNTSRLLESLEPRLLFSAAPASVGVNVDGVTDFSTSYMFVDAMKNARGFGSPNAPWDMSATVDANGWPTQDAGACIITLPTQYSSQQQLPDISGTYHFSATGYCKVNGVASNLTVTDWNYNAATNTTTANVNVAKGATQLYLSFTQTNGGVKNIKLIRPGYAANTSQTFTSSFLTSIQNVSALRFMDFTATNNNPVVNWSDRALPTDATQTSSRGAAWEYVIDLANTAHKDVWINIPVGATDDYVDHLAGLLKTDLDPSLHVYVEFSNEVWNWSFGQFQTNYDAAQTEEAANPSVLNYDNSNNTYYYAWRRVAERLVQISNDFASVYGQSAINTTVRPVLASQIGWGYVLRNQLEFMNTVYGSPSKYIYAVAGAPYINIGDLSSSSALTVDQVIAGLENSIHSSITAIDQYEALSQDYRLKDLCYEGGIDLEGDTGGNFANAKILANYDPRIAQVMTDYLNALYANNVSMLMYYSVSGTYSPSGTWGLTEDLANLSGPKYTAFNNFPQTASPAITGGAALAAATGGATSIAGGAYVADNGENPGAGGDATANWSGNTYDYVVNASSPAIYSLSLTIGSWYTGSLVHLIVDGIDRGDFSLAATSSGQFLTTDTLSLGALAAGMHTIRLDFPTGGYDLQSLNITNVLPAADSRPTDPATPSTPTTPSDPTQSAPFVPPATSPTLTATPLSPTQTTLSWAADAAATGYIIERSPNGKRGWSPIATVTAGVTTYIDAGLSPRKKYFYRIQSLNGAGHSPYSTTVAAKTLAVAPLKFAIAQPDTSSLQLSWNEPGGAGSYLVQQLVAGKWVTLTALAAGATTYTDINVSTGKVYSYRLLALDTLGDVFLTSGKLSRTLKMPRTAAARKFLHPAILRRRA